MTKKKRINLINLRSTIARFVVCTAIVASIDSAISSDVYTDNMVGNEDHILLPDFVDGFDIAPPTTSGRIIKIWSTQYYTLQPKIVRDGVPFRDKNGAAISDNVSQRDWCLGAQEGSIKTSFKGKDVRLTHGGEFQKKPSYAVNCDIPFPKSGISGFDIIYHQTTRTPYGYGIKNWLLVPYRTIAAELYNKELNLKAGDVIYISALRGTPIDDPVSGKVIKHDGYFFIGDRGSKIRIKGPHVDTFCAFVKYCLPKFTGSDEKNPSWFTAQVINDPDIKDKLKKMHLKESYK